MAISPPSDIVLDVAKAADPLQYSAAVEKLARLSSAGAAEAASFGTFLDAAEPAAEAALTRAEPAFVASRADLRNRLPAATFGSAAQQAAAPYRQFEAFVLQTFVQSMLPKDASHVFGSGLSGEIYSSMLAEQIAGQVAKAGGIGIAESIAARHPAGTQTNSSQPLSLLPTRAASVSSSDAFALLPGKVASLELGFADSVLGADADDDASATDDGLAA